MNRTQLAALAVMATGCIANSDDEPHISMQASAATVADYVATGCSTAVLLGLARQVAEEANCEHPGNFESFAAGNGISFANNGVVPFLERSARLDLQAVAAGHPMMLNSVLRTLPEQYLLYHYYLQGRCGITKAATPGTSNHESGRALDVQNYSSSITPMANRGWAHDVAGDPVHFDHLASPDHRGEDVSAFQTLWNRNHPGDLIAVDGIYGPQTEARLRMSPVTGFPMGASCIDTTHYDAQVVSVDGPDRLPPVMRAHYSLTLKNSGTKVWPAATQLELASGTSSQLHDDSWTSATVITTIGADVAVGAMGTVEFDVMTPATEEELPITEKLNLNSAGSMFGTIDFAVTVDPKATGPTSDGNEGGDASGGCNAGGTGSGAGLALALGLALCMPRRRRR